MSMEEYEDEEERRRRLRRRQMLEKMKKEKRRREIILKRVVPAAVCVCLIFAIFLVGRSVFGKKDVSEVDVGRETRTAEQVQNGTVEQAQNVTTETEQAGRLASAREGAAEQTERALELSAFCEWLEPLPERIVGEIAESEEPVWKDMVRFVPLSARCTAATKGFGEEILSTNGVLIDMDEKEILARRGYDERINPASMTKILTVLVAAEHVKDLDDTFTITRDIADYTFIHDCSVAGYEVGETVTVRDLFYGTILPSGGDAALGLAIYVAGSQDAFVELMNEKLAELGLSDTSHFTNCIGIYQENHYSTTYDIAVMLSAAIQNELCRDVLSAHTYPTSSTEIHPEGILISNWFLRRIEDKETHGEVLYAKTGYVTQSGCCAASIACDKNGKRYACVTVGAASSWKCINDHAALYRQFLPE